jgi:hypothetical protein
LRIGRVEREAGGQQAGGDPVAKPAEMTAALLALTGAASIGVTILKSMSSDMRRTRLWALAKAVPSTNTSRNGPPSTAATACMARMTCQSFSTVAAWARPKWSWTARKSTGPTTLPYRSSTSDLPR